MFGLRADMETYTLPHRLIAFRLIASPRHILNNGQKPLKLWRLGDGYMVAEGGNLVANTLKGVAVPTTVDNKATSDGGALGLVADKFNVHIFLFLVMSLREVVRLRRVVCASRRLPLHSSHHPRKACITSPTATSLAIAVLVVNTDQTAAEGEYFAEGDENRVMDLCQWWADEARGEHYAPEGAESNGYSQLKIFHIFKI